MTTYSKHKPQAAAFLAFLASDEGQQIIADNGIIPTKEGFTSDQRMAKDLLALAADQGFTRYPMIDNVIQPEVSDVGHEGPQRRLRRLAVDEGRADEHAADPRRSAGRLQEPDQVAIAAWAGASGPSAPPRIRSPRVRDAAAFEGPAVEKRTPPRPARAGSAAPSDAPGSCSSSRPSSSTRCSSRCRSSRPSTTA